MTMTRLAIATILYLIGVVVFFVWQIGYCLTNVLRVANTAALCFYIFTHTNTIICISKNYSLYDRKDNKPKTIKFLEV